MVHPRPPNPQCSPRKNRGHPKVLSAYIIIHYKLRCKLSRAEAKNCILPYVTPIRSYESLKIRNSLSDVA